MPITVADRQPNARLWAAAGAMSGFAMSEENRLKRQQMAVQIMQQIEQVRALRQKMQQEKQLHAERRMGSPGGGGGGGGGYRGKGKGEPSGGYVPSSFETLQPVRHGGAYTPTQQSRYAISRQQIVERQETARRERWNRVMSGPGSRTATPTAGRQMQ